MLGVGGIVRRVIEEEEMLKMDFGREWEQWTRRTWRLVPGLW
jgi:protein-S-isoprenylcysteine O-methyltransferase Ste14